MMYQYLFIFIFVATSALFSVSKVSEIEKAKQEYMDRFDPRDYINISIFYPVSTNTSPEQITFLNMSLFYSYVLNSKIDISGGISRTWDAPYLQMAGVGTWNGIGYKGHCLDNIKNYDYIFHFAGIYNLTMSNRRALKGCQVSSLRNRIRYLNGVQMSFGYNRSDELIKGMQIGTINNSKDVFGLQFSLGHNRSQLLEGAQVSGLYNRTKVMNHGLQISSVFNYSWQIHSGIQISGLVNYIRHVSKNSFHVAGIYNYGVSTGTQIDIVNHSWRNYLKGGKQIGLCNLSINDSILQIGVMNFRKRPGRQIGLLNYARDSNNKIGFMNIDNNSKLRYNAFINNFSKTEISFEAFNEGHYSGISSGLTLQKNTSFSVKLYKGVRLNYSKMDYLIDYGFEYNDQGFQNSEFVSRVITNFSKYDLYDPHKKLTTLYRSASSFVGLSIAYNLNNYTISEENFRIGFIYGVSFMFY